MKITFAVSEMAPFAKTGGLGDVASSLSAALARLGHEVKVFLPKYKCVDIRKFHYETAIDRIAVPMGSAEESARIESLKLNNGVHVFFVDHPGFYDREELYGTAQGDYPDNDRRFTFFQRAVLESLKKLGQKQDIVHCHDWQTGLIPTYLKTLYHDSFFQKTKSVFTIHNLGYQGNFPPDSLAATGLGWNEFRIERLEFYGKLSFMKAALLDSDILTTVSERYAQEIQSKEFGCGMEGVLAKRKNSLIGIVNGIDPEEWDPRKDPELAAHFDAKKLDKKSINKSALQKDNGLTIDPKVPVIGMVSRLVDQKGLDILIPALGEMLETGTQFICLGTGEEKYHHTLRDIAKKNKGKLAVHILFDAKMAKRIYASCDMLLMPSYYEPCGLGQMIAMRYGTIPVVRQVGGLADTVKDYDSHTGSGNGFSFEEYSSIALLNCVKRAAAIFHQEKKWHDLMAHAMTCDFSWSASAKRYVQAYESAKVKV